MTTWFVSRHPGAKEWATRQSIDIDRAVTHLNLDEVRPGDRVIGTLPVNLAEKICALGASYLHLSLELPAELRGKELSASEMEQYNAHLTQYYITQTPSP